MSRFSELKERLRERLENRFGGWFERHRENFSFYIPAGLIGLYFYGMFLNSMRLGIRS